MDHAVKIWALDTEEVKSAIEASCKATGDGCGGKRFKTRVIHYPSFSTCAVQPASPRLHVERAVRVLWVRATAPARYVVGRLPR